MSRRLPPRPRPSEGTPPPTASPPPRRSDGVPATAGRRPSTARGWLRAGAVALFAALAAAGCAGPAGSAADANATAAAAAAAVSPDTNTWFVLVNRNSGKALDDYGLSLADGGDVVQWARNDGNWQQWQFVDVRRRLLPAQSPPQRQGRSSLPVVDGRRRRRRAVGRPSGTNQQLAPRRLRQRLRPLVNRHSGKALDVWEWSTADGGDISQFADLGGCNQQWQLVPIGPAAAPTPTRRPPAPAWSAGPPRAAAPPAAAARRRPR